MRQGAAGCRNRDSVISRNRAGCVRDSYYGYAARPLMRCVARIGRRHRVIAANCKRGDKLRAAIV